MIRRDIKKKKTHTQPSPPPSPTTTKKKTTTLNSLSLCTISHDPLSLITKVESLFGTRKRSINLVAAAFLKDESPCHKAR